MKTADRVVESSLKQTSKLVNKKQLEVQVCPSSIIQYSKRSWAYPGRGGGVSIKHCR